MKRPIRYGRSIVAINCLFCVFLACPPTYPQTDPLPSWNDGAAKQGIIPEIAEQRIVQSAAVDRIVSGKERIQEVLRIAVQRVEERRHRHAETGDLVALITVKRGNLDAGNRTAGEGDRAGELIDVVSQPRAVGMIGSGRNADNELGGGVDRYEPAPVEQVARAPLRHVERMTARI